MAKGTRNFGLRSIRQPYWHMFERQRTSGTYCWVPEQPVCYECFHDSALYSPESCVIGPPILEFAHHTAESEFSDVRSSVLLNSDPNRVGHAGGRCKFE